MGSVPASRQARRTHPLGGPHRCPDAGGVAELLRGCGEIAWYLSPTCGYFRVQINQAIGSHTTTIRRSPNAAPGASGGIGARGRSHGGADRTSKSTICSGSADGTPLKMPEPASSKHPQSDQRRHARQVDVSKQRSTLATESRRPNSPFDQVARLPWAAACRPARRGKQPGRWRSTASRGATHRPGRV